MRVGRGWLAVVALLLTACSGGVDADGRQVVPEDVVLHPQGPPGAWLLDDYANGVGEMREFPRELCGIGGDIAVRTIAREPDPNAAARLRDTDVVGTDLITGEEAWRLEHASCDPSVSDAPDFITATRDDETRVEPSLGYPQDTLGRIDPATGEFTFYADLEANRMVTVVNAVDDLILVEPGLDETLTALEPGGGVAWEYDLGELGIESSGCRAIEGHVACQDVEHGYVVLDARTGRPTAGPISYEDEGVAFWARDGFLMSEYSDENAVPFRAFTWDGEPVELEWLDTVGEEWVPMHDYSRLDTDIFYPLEEQGLLDTVRFTDRQGRPVILAEAEPAGPIGVGKPYFADGVPFDEDAVRAVTASGGAALLEGESKVRILSRDGAVDQQIEWGDHPSPQPRVLGGYLVVDTSYGAEAVVLPAS